MTPDTQSSSATASTPPATLARRTTRTREPRLELQFRLGAAHRKRRSARWSQEPAPAAASSPRTSNRPKEGRKHVKAPDTRQPAGRLRCATCTGRGDTSGRTSWPTSPSSSRSAAAAATRSRRIREQRHDRRLRRQRQRRHAPCQAPALWTSSEPHRAQFALDRPSIAPGRRSNQTEPSRAVQASRSRTRVLEHTTSPSPPRAAAMRQDNAPVVSVDDAQPPRASAASTFPWPGHRGPAYRVEAFTIHTGVVVNGAFQPRDETFNFTDSCGSRRAVEKRPWSAALKCIDGS